MTGELRYSTRAAAISTLGFTLVAIFAAVQTDFSPTLLPLLAIHIFLLLNTFFSIRCFAAITLAWDYTQIIINFLLSLVYLISPFYFNRPLGYLGWIIFLFILATIKYLFLRQGNVHQALLGRKIIVDILCAVYWSLFWLLAARGFVLEAVTIGAIIFGLGSWVVIVLWPIYELDSHA